MEDAFVLSEDHRKVDWWNTVNTLYNEERFKQEFRISRSTFHYNLLKVAPVIFKGRYWCWFSFTGRTLSYNTLQVGKERL